MTKRQPKLASESVGMRMLMKTVIDTTTGCWNYTGGRTGKGYGCISYEGKTQKAHRIAWRLHRGPIPSGLTLDHLCRNRVCVNPAHLEPVDMRTNTLRGEGVTAVNARKERCKRGHLFGPEDVSPRGYRECRQCALLYYEKYYCADPAETSKRRKKYRAANKDKINATTRAWYAKRQAQPTPEKGEKDA